MINTELYLTRKIKKLQNKIDSLYFIGDFCSKIKFFLDKNSLLDYNVRNGFTLLYNGEAMFFLKTNENNNNNVITNGLYDILKKHQKKDFFSIDWIIYKNDNPYNNICIIMVEWYKPKNHLTNGFNGIDL